MKQINNCLKFEPIFICKISKTYNIGKSAANEFRWHSTHNDFKTNLKRGIHKLLWQARREGDHPNGNNISLCNKLFNAKEGGQNPINVVYGCPQMDLWIPSSFMGILSNEHILRNLRKQLRRSLRIYAQHTFNYSSKLTSLKTWTALHFFKQYIIATPY